MNRIISFIVLICLITGLLFVGTPGVLAAESPASAVSIPQAANYTAISAGNGFTLALKDNGTVAAWGNNGIGQRTVPAGLSGVKAIAAGGNHSVALKEDGTVVAWGYNGYGQCTVPEGLSGVKAIAAGDIHTIALKEDGTVAAWGNNDSGQCTVPTGLSGVKAIATGSNHTVALKEDGTVVSWGSNSYGQCTVPTGLSGVKAIAEGDSYTIALKEDGTVVAWGYNGHGQCTVPTGLSGVKAITAGFGHAVALKEDGTVVAWGYNGYGQCNVPTGLSGVKAIAAQGYSTVVLKEDGTIISFGDQSYIIPSTKASSANAITSSNAEFNTSNPESITVKMYADGSNKLTGIKSGENSLTSSDYSISGSAITINKAYLSSCFASSDKLSLTFDFDNGVDPNLSIEKNDCTKNSIYKSISTGYNFTLALEKDGIVAAWGDNRNGQCNVPAGLSGVKAVAVGYSHSVALKEDGTVVAWGYNGYKQCNVPAGLSGVKAISAGQYHTVALKEDGTVVAWGYNTYAQCASPAGLYGVKDIAAGENFTVALKTDGTVAAWGNNDNGQCNVPADLSDVKAISAGQNHVVALKTDGTVVAWGYNGYKQCNVPSGLLGVKAISAGYYHTVALKEDGTLITWGNNESGQCNVPTGLSGVKAVSARYYSTVALKDNGTIISFGNRNYIIPSTKTLSANSLNLYSTEFDSLNPSDISVKTFASDKNKLIGIKNGTDSLTASDYSISGSAVTINSTYLSSYFVNASKLSLTFDFDNGNDPVLTVEKNDGGKDSIYKDIKSGCSSTMALKTDGTVVVWGDNNYVGECYTRLSGVKAIAAGQYHFVALKEDGTVTAWGNSNHGECNVPAGLSNVKSIAAGQYHTLALKEDGTVVAWGDSDYGQCVIPSGLSGIRSIAAGENHSVALKEDGTVVAWGDNDNNQCNIPDGLSGVKSIAAGNNHTAAIKEDGTAIAWGNNRNGQCNVPSGLSGVKAVAAGESHSVALKEDGTITAWGNNSLGQCTIPKGLSDVKAISTAGYLYTLVLKKDDTIIAFGSKNFTIPTTKNSITPYISEFDTSNPSNITINICTNGNKLISIKNGSDPLSASDYSVSGSAVTINKAYLSSCFTKASKLLLTFDFDNGDDPVLTVSISTPAITVDPMEITVGKSNDVMITVNKNGYPVSGGTVDIGSYVKGQVLDSNGQAKVAVTPTTAGDIVVNAYDINHNLLISKTIKAVVATTTDSSIAPLADIFNTLSPVDIKTTMTLNGNTLVNIMNGAAPLTKSDYSVNGNVVTINKGFFSYYFDKFGKFKTNCILTFKFSSGKDATLTVKPIFDALLTPDTANFDSSNPADVKVTMAISGNTLTSIMNGAAPLSKSDYSVSGNVATINKGFFNYYFSKFSNNCSLKFIFSDGKYAFLTVKPYTNANDPSISPNTTTCNIVSPEAIQVTMTLNGSTLGSIMNGSAPLTKYDYSVNGNIVTITKGYLAYYFGRFPKYNCNLTFKFSNGKDITLTIKPAFSDSSISPAEATYDMTTPQSITVALALNGNKLTSVKDSVKTLSEGTDYSVSGSSVLLKTDYLNNLPLGDSTITFNFDAGKSASLKITVNGEVKDSTISPDVATCSITTPESIKVTMALNGNTLVNVMNGVAPLTKYDYSVSGNVVTINKSYFVYYFGRFPKYNCTLTFKFSNGKDAVFTVKPAQ